MEDIGVLLLCTAGLAATASGLPPFLRVEIGEVGDEHVHIITTIQGCFAGGRKQMPARNEKSLQMVVYVVEGSVQIFQLISDAFKNRY